jgi:hypothetical protein
LATVTPSLVIRGAVGFIENHVAALGPERHTDRVGQRVDAAQHALARVRTQANVFCSHDLLSPSAGNDAHDVRLFHDDQILAVELDLVTRPFAEQHPVARLDIERMDLPVVISNTRPDGNDFASVGACGCPGSDAAGGFDFTDAATTTRRRRKFTTISPGGRRAPSLQGQQAPDGARRNTCSAMPLIWMPPIAHNPNSRGDLL